MFSIIWLKNRQFSVRRLSPVYLPSFSPRHYNIWEPPDGSDTSDCLPRGLNLGCEALMEIAIVGEIQAVGGAPRCVSTPYPPGISSKILSERFDIHKYYALSTFSAYAMRVYILKVR